MNDFLDDLEDDEGEPKVQSADNWDPREGEKIWVRHKDNGNEGWIVRRDGQEMVHLNRGAQTIEVPFDEFSWIEQDERRPLSDISIALVAQAADQVLCHVLGLHEGRKGWIDLHEQEKRKWIEGRGVPDNADAVRHVMFDAITGVLRSFAES